MDFQEESKAGGLPRLFKIREYSFQLPLRKSEISRESHLGLARAVPGSLGPPSARSGRARPARKSPGAGKVEKIEFLEVFEATPDLYGLELPDSKNGKDFRVSTTFLVRTAFLKSGDPGFPMDPAAWTHIT